jgi:hypothetical protein
MRGVDDAVPHAVPAIAILEVFTHGLPRGRPKLTVGIVAQVEVASAGIQGDIVAAAACQPPVAGIPIETVPSRRVRNQGEEFLRTQLIDPRQRRIRLRDHVLAQTIVEIPKIHINSLCLSADVKPLWIPSNGKHPSDVPFLRFWLFRARYMGALSNIGKLFAPDNIRRERTHFERSRARRLGLIENSTAQETRRAGARMEIRRSYNNS